MRFVRVCCNIDSSGFWRFCGGFDGFGLVYFCDFPGGFGVGILGFAVFRGLVLANDLLDFGVLCGVGIIEILRGFGVFALFR